MAKRCFQYAVVTLNLRVRIRDAFHDKDAVTMLTTVGTTATSSSVVRRNQASTLLLFYPSSA